MGKIGDFLRSVSVLFGAPLGARQKWIRLASNGADLGLSTIVFNAETKFTEKLS